MDTIYVYKQYIVTIIISLQQLRHNGLLQSLASDCRVSPKISIHLVDNGKFEMGFLSGAFKEFFSS